MPREVGVERHAVEHLDLPLAQADAVTLVRAREAGRIGSVSGRGQRQHGDDADHDPEASHAVMNA